MTILVTGSTGKLGSALITLLQSTTHPFLAATRRTPPPASLSSVPTVHFDWRDETTWPNPFTTATITKIFLLSPTVPDPAPLVNKFITYATTHHSVARFVLMSSASAQKGGPMFGQMWSHLAATGVPYALVGPSWVDENFLDARYVAEIQDGKIYSGMGEGRAPWVAARDVAGVSLWALTVGEEELRGRENVVVATRERITMGEVSFVSFLEEDREDDGWSEWLTRCRLRILSPRFWGG